MPLHLHWFLPSHGDGRTVARVHRGPHRDHARDAQREPDIGYLAQVARAADRFGFVSVLVPAGLFCEDPWLVSAALAQQTGSLRFMVAMRPGLMSPTLTAQMAATAQRLTGGRLLLNVVAGGDADEQRRYGDWVDHEGRYERADQFLDVVRRIWRGETVDIHGEYFRLRGARVARLPEPAPQVYLGGSSPAAQRVAARHADVYLAWGEPPDRLAPLLAAFRERAAEHRRVVSTGTRFHVIARDTEAEAWTEAERLVAGMDPEMVAAAQRRVQASESEGQRRMATLHGGRIDRLEVYPNVWAGYGLLRPGAGAALVGSHEQVAERIEEYRSIGVEHIILSGQPHLEEAYWFSEGVMPILAARGVLAGREPPPDAAAPSTSAAEDLGTATPLSAAALAGDQ